VSSGSVDPPGPGWLGPGFDGPGPVGPAQDRESRIDFDVQAGHRVPQHAGDVAEHRVVEVRAAELLDALGRAEHRVPVAGAPQHRRVERAAAQVVHADHLAGRHPLGGSEVDRRGLRFGDGPDVGPPGAAEDLVELLPLVRSPVRRVRHHHLGRRGVVARRHGVQHVPQQLGEQGVRRVRRAADQQRHRVTEAAFDLAYQPGRVGLAVAFGGRGVGRAEIDTERVLHATLPAGLASRPAR
jgi:hypothetical protein